MEPVSAVDPFDLMHRNLTSPSTSARTRYLFDMPHLKASSVPMGEKFGFFQKRPVIRAF
jgi:hypothetical protein